MTTSIYTGGNFYVYLITDLNPVGEARYYIGSRTNITLVEQNIRPENDPYMGSSYHSDMIQGLKERPADFEKVIIETYTDKDDCLLAEEWFQRQHFAVENEEFFNKVYANSKFTHTTESALKASTSLKRTFNNPEWKETTGKTKTLKRSATISNSEWKKTVGVEASQKQKTTKNDPEWKKTVGVEASQKQKTTKNDPEWKETVGKEMGAKISEIRNDPEWKETVGKDAISKLLITISNPEWKARVGEAAEIKRRETKSDPKWKETVGRKATLNGIRTTFSYRRITFRDLGPFITSTELAKALMKEYGVSLSVSVINKNIVTNFSNTITRKMLDRTKFLQELVSQGEIVIGKTFSEVGFQYNEVWKA